MNQGSNLATLLGLGIALGGTVLPVSKLFGNPGGFTARLLEQGYLWLLFSLILAIVLCGERLPLSSIGLRWQWQSVPWGFLLAAMVIYITAPFGEWVLQQSGLPGFEAGFAKLARLPAWFLIFAVVTAGIVEETLYRGYAIERLTLLMDNVILAGVFAWVIFGLVHLPFWGWGPVLSISIAGLPLLVFYLWQRDLLACIIAHAVTDMVGLVILPALLVKDL